MTTRTFARINRMMLSVLGGGAMLQISSCSDEVQSAVIAGAEGTAVAIASALIAAFFEGFLV